MDEKNLAIGVRIKDARKAKGLTLKQLGGLVERTESLIGRYEKGKVDIPHNMITKLADALGVSAIYLQYGQTPQERASEVFVTADEQYVARIKQSRADSEATTTLYETYGFTYSVDGEDWIVKDPDGNEYRFDQPGRTAYGTITVKGIKEYALFIHQQAVKEVLGEE